MQTRDLTKLRIDEQDRGSVTGGSKRLRLWIGALVAVIIAVGLLAWSGILKGPAEVRTSKAALMFASRPLTMLNASGYVVAQRKAAVSSKATGRLEQLYVEEGKRVKEGDVLAQLENEDLKAALSEAEAGLRAAQAALVNSEAELHDATLQYNRQKALTEAKVVSAQSMDAAEARYKKALASERSARHLMDRAQASLKVAEVNLDYSFIKAPFDGVILTKNADKGEVVAPFGAATNAKAAVATMADPESLMVEVDVAESSLTKVKLGGFAEIRLDAYPADRFPGLIHMVVPTADRSKATVMTKVRFLHLDEKVLPEMSAKVAFLERPLNDDEQTPFIGVPESAVRKLANRDSVFVVDGGKAHAVPVTTGRKWSDTVEIVSGLKQGDVFVAAPEASLTDGARVKAHE